MATVPERVHVKFAAELSTKPAWPVLPCKSVVVDAQEESPPAPSKGCNDVDATFIDKLVMFLSVYWFVFDTAVGNVGVPTVAAIGLGCDAVGAVKLAVYFASSFSASLYHSLCSHQT